jgi:hypothetical protein
MSKGQNRGGHGEVTTTRRELGSDGAFTAGTVRKA